MTRATKIYKKIFKDNDMDNVGQTGFVQVRCPFHNDEHESAGVDPKSGFFNCFTCDSKYKNIDEFLSAFHKVSIQQARKIEALLDENIDLDWVKFMENLNTEHKEKIMSKLDISANTIKELKLGHTMDTKELFTIPAILNGVVLDARRYRPNQVPKVLGAKGSISGLIIPFDLWVNDKRPTLICAGEKDMIIARDRGFNAITITGGELKLPTMFGGHFKDKKVVIFYDNDDAGKKGANKLGEWLDEKGAKAIKLITDHYSWMENKEDCFDFFVKYKKTADDLKAIIKNTPILSKKEVKELRSDRVKLLKLHEAREGKYRNTLVQSNVQVVSTFSTAMSVPTLLDGKALVSDMVGNNMKRSWKTMGSWSLGGNNIKEILKLMENEKMVKAEYDRLTGIKRLIENAYGVKEAKGIPRVSQVVEEVTVYKSSIIDYSEDDVISKKDQDENKGELEEITVYTLGEKLENGKSYNIQYKIVAHPNEKQNTVAIALKVEEATSGVQSFKITPQTKKALQKFENQSLATLYSQFKDYTGNFVRQDLFLATDLTFHSPLKFNYHNKIKRGVIYSSVIGESRTGKSESVQGAIKKYKLGTIINAKLATIVGIAGGSTNKDGGWKTTAGVIPRNHKLLVALEEVQGAPTDYHKKLTEVKSSGRLRIIRSDGELKLDCLVRLLEISNQKTMRGHTKKLEVYANGIEVINELIPAIEDIARQDFFVLVPEPKKYIERDDMTGVLESFDSEDYKTRVLWAWSRKPSQIKFEDGVLDHIWKESQDLNKTYNSHIKIFGSETDIKLARLSVALASMRVSTDATYENIIVKKEHVDFIKKWLISLYDNDLFRLKQYVTEERSYSEINDNAITKLEGLYAAHPILISQLETSSTMQRTEVQAISGLDPKDFSIIYNSLFKWKFIKLKGSYISPTERFRKGMKKIDRTLVVKELGQETKTSGIVFKKPLKKDIESIF